MTLRCFLFYSCFLCIPLPWFSTSYFLFFSDCERLGWLGHERWSAERLLWRLVPPWEWNSDEYDECQETPPTRSYIGIIAYSLPCASLLANFGKLSPSSYSFRTSEDVASHSQTNSTNPALCTKSQIPAVPASKNRKTTNHERMTRMLPGCPGECSTLKHTTKSTNTHNDYSD